MTIMDVMDVMDVMGGMVTATAAMPTAQRRTKQLTKSHCLKNYFHGDDVGNKSNKI